MSCMQSEKMKKACCWCCAVDPCVCACVYKRFCVHVRCLERKSKWRVYLYIGWSTGFCRWRGPPIGFGHITSLGIVGSHFLCQRT